MGSPSSRALQMLSLLQGGREWSLNDLTRRFGVSARTLRRDVYKLRELGYVVRSRPGPGAGYTLVPGVKIPPLVLTPEEVTTLTTGLLLLEAWSPQDAAVIAVRAKLEQVLPPGLRRHAAAVALSTQVLAEPPSHADWSDLSLLAKAVASGERVAFDYVDQHGTRTNRLVEPYRHVMRQRHWYLVAYDIDRESWRLFRIDRMRHASVRQGSRTQHSFPFTSIEDWLTTDFGRAPKPQNTEGPQN